MKNIIIIILTTIITLNYSGLGAQVYTSGQLNNSYIYPIIEEHGPERLFTGISAEIGAEGMNTGICLKSGLYLPKKYIFEKPVEDPYGYYFDAEVEQKVSVYELGFFGRYYLIGEQGSLVRVFTNSGIEMVWARAKDEYLNIYTDELTEEKFTNKNLRVGLGVGFEVEVGENLYLLNDFMFKYALSDMEYGGFMFVDPAYDYAFNFNIGVKMYLN